MMRMSLVLVVAALSLVSAGCRSNPTSVAAGGPGITENPVGPIPGGEQSFQYSVNPFAHDPVAVADGRRLFLWYNCVGCHGGHAGGGMGPSLRDQVWLYGSRDDQIFDSVAKGRSKGMPAWGSRIPQNQIWELVAYIKSLRTPQEPDPPTEPASEEVEGPVSAPAPNVGTQSAVAGRHP
jgi:cytochrome c oxidase cbb3-type subunit III